MREEQRPFAVEPKLMFQQNIACVLDQGMSNPKIHSGCEFGPSGKLFPPARACLFLFEHITHASSAFRSQKSNTLVA
ncbi:hypothetical protein CP49_21135 [Bradyrhizobium valentinum]|uniref:Uncharacterized protein n=1 Tax=Bradyrhizobium valentinum TaxID=1518501 RepID=A0A0R3LND7_9BRAD|nr:hypothetical protein CP49_21135 [Bradyrhizobium valentinum]